MMNSFLRKVTVLMLAGLSTLTTAHAQSLAGSAPNSGANNNPYNSPIHRANPNSRQGTQPVTPPGRTPVPPPTLRTPTLENGGIGNGYPTRQIQTPRPPPRPAMPTRPSTTP